MLGLRNVGKWSPPIENKCYKSAQQRTTTSDNCTNLFAANQHWWHALHLTKRPQGQMWTLGINKLTAGSSLNFYKTKEIVVTLSSSHPRHTGGLCPAVPGSLFIFEHSFSHKCAKTLGLWHPRVILNVMTTCALYFACPSSHPSSVCPIPRWCYDENILTSFCAHELHSKASLPSEQCDSSTTNVIYKGGIFTLRKIMTTDSDLTENCKATQQTNKLGHTSFRSILHATFLFKGRNDNSFLWVNN